MTLSTIDWTIIIGFLGISLLIGLLVSQRAGKSSSEYFLSGRQMPWWLLGISMVATTFSADTPNLVTDIVRKNGVSGNWVWWAFLLTGMLTVFVYARLWRRAGIFTDLEFYELRYGGKMASFLRGFRAIYLGVFFNVVIMATVNLAAIKIGGVLLGLEPIHTLLIASIVTLAYTVMGGLRAVIITDLFQFIVAMIGTILAAYYIIQLPEIGSLNTLFANEAVAPKLDIFPDFNDKSNFYILFILPIAVQWWSVWYPGAEPGGGGYVAQRILSAKNEKHALGATLLFNFAHYALRPWPWIIIALASVVLFPDMESLRQAFPNVPYEFINDDLAYSAMLSYLPHGLLGVVVGSLIAAFMSTISTHLNWGASYVVKDFWVRFISPEMSEKKQVLAGRLTTVMLLIFSAILALFLSNALQAFNILLQIGAGTGLLFILRWFWWRINAWSEICAMTVSFLIACYFEFMNPDVATHLKLLYGVGVTTIAWILVTLLTPPENESVLTHFCKLIRPYKFGWKPIINSANIEYKVESSFIIDMSNMILGTFLIYNALWSIGQLLYGDYSGFFFSFTAVLGLSYFLYRNLNKSLK